LSHGRVVGSCFAAVLPVFTHTCSLTVFPCVR
jgi:hypothetical protein